MGKRRERKRLERETSERLEDEELDKLIEFPELPGTHLRCRRSVDAKKRYEFYRVATAAPIVTAYNGSREFWRPSEIIVAGTPFLVKRHQWAGEFPTEVIDTRNDQPVIRATGNHFNHDQSTRVFLSEGRILTFPVLGESRWLSEMAAVDAESKVWIRFRLQASLEESRNLTENVLILIEPDIGITTEILLTIALMAGSLDSYFKKPAGGGA